MLSFYLHNGCVMMPKQPLLLTIKHKYIILLVFTALTVFFSFGISKLTIDTSMKQIYNKNSEQYKTYIQHNKTYNRERSIFLFAKSPTIYTTHFITTYHNLIQELQENENIINISSIFNLPHITRHDDLTVVEQLIPDKLITTKNFPIIKQRLQKNKQANDNLIAANNTLTISHVSLNLIQPNTKIASTLNNLIRKYNKPPYEFGFVGSTTFDNTVQQILKHEIISLLLISYAVIILICFILFKKFIALILPVLTSTIAIIWTLGILGYCHIPLNYFSSSIPVMLVVVGSTEDIFLLSAYFKGKKIYNKNIFAIKYMLNNVSYSIILTSITTTIGFLSFAFLSVPVFQQWGLAISIGLFLNGLITLIFAPVIIHMFDRKNKIKENSYNFFEKSALLAWKIINKNRTGILIVFSLFSILCIYQLKTLDINLNLNMALSNTHPVKKNINMIKKEFKSYDQLFINIKSPENESWTKKNNLKKLLQFTLFIEEQPSFNFVESLASNIAKINQNMHSNDKYYKIPHNQNTILQYLSFFNNSRLKGFLSADQQQTRIKTITNISSSNNMENLIQNISNEFHSLFPNNYTLQITGKHVLSILSAKSLLQETLTAYTILLILTFILFSYNFRSLKAGLISIVINGFPALALLGIISILHIAFDASIAGVLAIALCISIDNTVHFMIKYSQLTYKYSSPKQGILKTIQEDLQPILISSLAAMGGFLILTFSKIFWIQQFGLFASIAIFFGLLADLIILPILLYDIRIINILDCFRNKHYLDILKNSLLFKGFSNSEISYSNLRM